MEFTGKSLLPLKKFCLKKLESDLHPLFIRGWGQRRKPNIILLRFKSHPIFLVLNLVIALVNSLTFNVK